MYEVGTVMPHLRLLVQPPIGGTLYEVGTVMPHLRLLVQPPIGGTLYEVGTVTPYLCSAAALKRLPVDVTMRAAGWSAESTFTRFHKKTASFNLGQSLLDSYLKSNWCEFSF